MDRSTVLLQGLRVKLDGWVPFIRRATHGDVVFSNLQDGEFSVTITWRTRNGPPGSFTKEFTKKYVFGASYQLSPAAWCVEKKVCEHAKDLVRSVLEERGVIARKT